MMWVRFSRNFLAAVVIALIANTYANATSIRIVVTDGPGEGFNSKSSTEPVAGNDARTLGEQYLNVFRAAARFYEARIDSDVEISIEASFDPLRCDASRLLLIFLMHHDGTPFMLPRRRIVWRVEIWTQGRTILALCLIRA